jgi:hypothetical protein
MRSSLRLKRRGANPEGETEWLRGKLAEKDDFSLSKPGGRGYFSRPPIKWWP